MDEDCSTGLVEAGVCQPIGGMTPDDLAPIDGTEPTVTVAVVPPPPAELLPETGDPLTVGLLVVASLLVAVGRYLVKVSTS